MNTAVLTMNEGISPDQSVKVDGFLTYFLERIIVAKEAEVSSQPTSSARRDVEYPASSHVTPLLALSAVASQTFGW